MIFDRTPTGGPTVASATDDPIDSIGENQVSDDQVSSDNGQDAGGANAADAGGADAVDDSGSDDAVDGPDLLEREGEAAADYLEGLLDIIDVDGDIDMDVDGDRAVVAVIGEHLRHLVGQGGSVLDALQELTRLAVARETGNRSRLMLDIAGYRARRRAELAKIGTQAAEKAMSTGESVALNPMSAFERKVVHDAVAAAGLRSESEGVEPERYVVVLPTRRDPAPEVAAATSAPNADGAAAEPVASTAAASTDESHVVTSDE
jgi:spoIIIJ-associated protein